MMHELLLYAHLSAHRTEPRAERVPENVGAKAADACRLCCLLVCAIHLAVRPWQPAKLLTLRTNAFSKKVENHAAAVALWFMYYNFCRIHQTLRVTPAMEAGISSHVWSVEELVGLVERKTNVAVA
jgi:hypothetical protein